MSDILHKLTEWHHATDLAIAREARDEIERLRAIVRVNGLRWGHTHAEIDAILAGNAEQEAP